MSALATHHEPHTDTARIFTRRELSDYEPSPYCTTKDLAKHCFRLSGLLYRIGIQGQTPEPGHATVWVRGLNAGELVYLRRRLQPLLPINMQVHVEWEMICEKGGHHVYSHKAEAEDGCRKCGMVTA